VEIREDFEALAGRRLPNGQPYIGEYRAYACPGCATLLQVDTYCPSQGGELPLWDIQLDPRWLEAHR
jgi:acetone carboxylase gamma subunit